MPVAMAKVWLIGVTVFVIALAVAGIVVALVTRSGGLLPADSPEGAVQRYLRALQDRDYEVAYGYLSSTSKNSCSLKEFLRQASYREVRDSHMTLEDTRRLDGTAIVSARVTVFDPEVPFAPSESSWEQTFELKLENGQWRVTWPDYRCTPLY
jgi:hypothetical protein